MSIDPRLRGTCAIHPDHRIGLIGEAPGPNTRSDYPMYPYPPNSAAGRLMRILGWDRRRYLLTFARANVLRDYPGPTFPGTSVRARACASKVGADLAGRPLLLLGKGVAAAFKIHASTPPLTWIHLPEVWGSPRAAVVPHPSGRNLWYNDPANCERVRAFVNELAGEYDDG